MNAKQTLAEKTNLAGLVVTADCRIQIVNEETWKYQTIAETCYTPRHINEILKINKLQSAWVNWMGGRELWFQGNEIATHG